MKNVKRKADTELLVSFILQVDSVRYGLVGIFVAIKDVKKGDEVFSNYGYSVKSFPTREWYTNEWNEFKANPANAEKVKWLLKAYGERMKD